MTCGYLRRTAGEGGNGDGNGNSRNEAGCLVWTRHTTNQKKSTSRLQQAGWVCVCVCVSVSLVLWVGSRQQAEIRRTRPATPPWIWILQRKRNLKTTPWSPNQRQQNNTEGGTYLGGPRRGAAQQGSENRIPRWGSPPLCPSYHCTAVLYCTVLYLCAQRVQGTVYNNPDGLAQCPRCQARLCLGIPEARGAGLGWAGLPRY